LHLFSNGIIIKSFVVQKKKERKKKKTSICSTVQESNVTDLTFEMCVPILRWIPAQLTHKKHPIFHEAQRGPINLIIKY